MVTTILGFRGRDYEIISPSYIDLPVICGEFTHDMLARDLREEI